MRELNEILEQLQLEVEILQGATAVNVSAFSDKGAFEQLQPQDVAAMFVLIGNGLNEISEKVDKALQWTAFEMYHGKETEA